MDKKTVRIIIISAVVLMAVCLCTVLAAGIGGFLFFSADRVVTDGVEKPSRVLPSAPTATLQIETGETPETDDSLPTITVDEEPELEENAISPELLLQLAEIESQVEALRGLPAAETIDRKTLSQESLNDRVMNDFFSDYSADEVRRDAQILSLFGLLDENYDLYDLFVRLYSEQIAGFYDSETKEMVVIQGEAFKGPERMTYAHEYTHALQDQTYDLDAGLMIEDEYCENNTEYCAAVQSLVEGDATLSEQLWLLEHATPQDIQDVLEFYESYQSPEFDSTPAFLQEDFIFPYEKGFYFVESLYNQGGYAAVDGAFLNPPVSTEQILHPEKYPDDRPVEISLPDMSPVLGDGWEEIDRNALGEWYLYLILNKPEDPQTALPDEKAAEAAAGWGGDQYLVYRQEESQELVLVSLTAWDTGRDAEEFFDAFANYAALRWGLPDIEESSRVQWSDDDEQVLVQLLGDQTLWVIAPDRLTLEQITSEITVFSEE